MTTPKLKGQVALIVGAGGGIGGSIALRIAREGASVAVADLNIERAVSVAREVELAGCEAIALEVDVSRARSVAETVAATVKRFTKLTTLINVAAAPTKRGTVESLTLDDWDRTLAVNLTGVFLTCKYSVPALRNAGGGTIINVASQLGHLATPGFSAYCTSKAALIFFTRTLAVDHTCDGIRANTISPGAIGTDRLSLAYGGNLKAAAAALGPRHLLGRLGTADEISSAAVFLASDDAAFITGTDLLVDGGYTAFKGNVSPDLKPLI